MVTNIGSGMGMSDTGSEAAHIAVSEAREALDNNAPDFAVVFSSSVYDYQDVVDTVRDETDGATLIGSSSAGEFTETKAEFESVTVLLIASDDMEFHVGLGTGLSEDIGNAVKTAAADLPTRTDDDVYRVGINVHDGLLGQGEEIAMLAYQECQIPFTGGSAGDDLNLEETVVFADDEVASDAVALAVLESNKPFAQAVGHGHEPIGDGHRVTSAEGSVIEELDGQPAYEVWKDVIRDTVEAELGLDIDEVGPDDDVFGELLTRFEFGIKTGDDDYKVRWPGLTPNTDGPMVFATKIPEGMELYVMDSGKDAQIEAAGRVGRQASDSPIDAAGALAFDCVCQAAILGDEFGDAVDSMAEELGVPLAGMQTYGEVAIQGDDLRAYHNTTSSILLIPE